MQFTMKAMAFVMAALVTLTACAPMANACTIPCIDDINPWGPKSSIVTLATLSHPGEKSVKWKITDTKTHKTVNVENVHKYKKFHVCTAVMKHGRTYKVSVKAKSHGKWGKLKSIGYRIY